MASNTDKSNLFVRVIYPYQKEVTFYMTFHKATIVTLEQKSKTSD